MWSARAYDHKHNYYAERWPHTWRRSYLHRRLDLDILVSMHRSRLMLVAGYILPARDFSQHCGKRIH